MPWLGPHTPYKFFAAREVISATNEREVETNANQAGLQANTQLPTSAPLAEKGRWE